MQEGRCRKIACLNFNQSGYKLDCFPSFHSSTSFHFVFVTSWHIFIKTAEKKLQLMREDWGMLSFHVRKILQFHYIPCQLNCTINGSTGCEVEKWILIHEICLSRLQLPTVECLNIFHNIKIHKKPIKVQQTTICLLYIPTWLCRYAPLIS